MSTPIRSKLTELQDNWRQLQTLCRQRRDALTTAFTTHKFLADLHELDLWVADTIKKMSSSELPNNVAEAEALLQLHNERKVIFYRFLKRSILSNTGNTGYITLESTTVLDVTRVHHATFHLPPHARGELF